METDQIDSAVSVSFADDTDDFLPKEEDFDSAAEPPLKRKRLEHDVVIYSDVAANNYDEETKLVIEQLMETIKTSPGSFSAALKSPSLGWLIPLPAELFANDEKEEPDVQPNIAITLDEVLSIPITEPPAITLPAYGEPRERYRNTNLDRIIRPIDDIVISTLSPDCLSSQLLAKHIVSELEKRAPEERKIVANKILEILKKESTTSRMS